MGYRRRRDSRPRRAPPRASRRRHRGHRGPRVLVGVRRGSPRLPAGIGRRRPGGVRGLPRQAVPARAARHRRLGRRRALAVRVFHLGVSYPHARSRHAAAGHARRDPGLARRGSRRPARGRLPRDPGPPQRALLRHRRRRHAPHRPGLPDGLPGRAPHAQDRALEAVAYALRRDDPASRRRAALREKPQGKRPPLRLHKRFTVVPRGIGLVVDAAPSPPGTATRACSRAS